jgi:hypothetical protein
MVVANAKKMWDAKEEEGRRISANA